jgi:hypothetical protein
MSQMSSSSSSPNCRHSNPSADYPALRYFSTRHDNLELTQQVPSRRSGILFESASMSENRRVSAVISDAHLQQSFNDRLLALLPHQRITGIVQETLCSHRHRLHITCTYADIPPKYAVISINERTLIPFFTQMPPGILYPHPSESVYL